MSDPDRTTAPGVVLPWDSSFFGVRIGRLQHARLTPESLRGVLDWAAAERLQCLYFFADANCPVTLSLAKEGGFQFIDLRVDLALALAEVQPEPAGEGFRAASPADLPALEGIAREAHTDTRFFKDVRFPGGRAADLYAEWIQRDFRVHQVFVVAGQRATAAGYVTCQVDREKKVGRIGLIAVDKGQQGQGLGRALVRGALRWFREQHCREVRVATQASNIAAQRLYQSLGFRTAEANATFHRWF